MMLILIRIRVVVIIVVVVGIPIRIEENRAHYVVGMILGEFGGWALVLVGSITMIVVG